MFDTVWKLADRGEDATLAGCENDVVRRVLHSRGIVDECEVSAFINPTLSNMSDPFLLPDMAAAVERILAAADSGEHITIFGDYDADGVTATAILYNFLTVYLEADVDYLLPSRFGDGYGLSKKTVDTIKSRGTSLIITVDTGIVAFAEIEYASSLGIDVVVTDHHNCAEKLPDCCAVVDPMREDSSFPTKQLAGAGVAFKVAEAIAYTIGVEDVSVYLPIAAIGTVGDSMPLTGENRIIVKNGLLLAEESLPGVRLATDSARSKDGILTARAVAFGIVPKINAAGRMGDAELALKLLLSEDAETAEEILNRLNELNTLRQHTESEITAQATSPEHMLTRDTDFITAVAGEDWHHGVTGIVASKLVEKYGKPAIVLSGRETDDEDNVYMRGSARSVDGINIYEALLCGSELMCKFGGHEMAAGFTVAVNNIEKLLELTGKDVARQRSETRYFLPKSIDCYLPQEMLTVETAERVESMGPFGVGNPMPVFITDGFKFVRSNAVGETKKHLKFRFAGNPECLNGGIAEGIAFNTAVYNKMVNSIEGCACVYSLGVNEWQGVRSVSLNVIDIIDNEYFVAKKVQSVYNENVADCIERINESFSFTRDELVAFYRALQQSGNRFVFDTLYEVKASLKAAGIDLPWFKIRYGLEVFKELGFIKKEAKGSYCFMTDGNGTAQKRNLNDSKLFNELKRS